MKMPLRFISELFCSSCTHSTVQVISPTIISSFLWLSVSPRTVSPRRVAPAPTAIAPPSIGAWTSPAPVGAWTSSAVVVISSIIVPVPGSVSPPPWTPAAAPSSWSPHVHAGGGGVSPLGDAVVDPDLPSVHLLAAHDVPSLSRILDVLIVDEGKAPASTAVAVQNNVHLLHRSKLAELGLKFSLRGVEAESKDAETLAGVGVFAIAKVPAAGGHRRPGMFSASLLRKRE